MGGVYSVQHLVLPSVLIFYDAAVLSELPHFFNSPVGSSEGILEKRGRRDCVSLILSLAGGATRAPWSRKELLTD